jgi:arabinogalactan oligomer/maltooligosaccharide transport system permease protein
MPPAEREVLEQQLKAYEFEHPGIRVRALYKETEELRSGFQAAALAGAGPDLIYGPSDVLGSFQTMGIIQDMAPWFTTGDQADFIPGALTFLPAADDPASSQLVQVGDRIGNHLALVINRNLLQGTPATTDDLIRMAVEQTVDANGDGRNERYGLVWNFVEPFFVIPVPHRTRGLDLRRPGRHGAGRSTPPRPWRPTPWCWSCRTAGR